jgi:hypothetical protein
VLLQSFWCWHDDSGDAVVLVVDDYLGHGWLSAEDCYVNFGGVCQGIKSA